jgi:hypothetical protein
MIFKTALVSLVLALAFAGAAVAKGHHHHRYPYVGSGVASKACKAEKAANPTAFVAKYGNAKHHRAHARCVAQHVRAARQACKAELASTGATAFNAKYGATPRRTCVRQHAGGTTV